MPATHINQDEFDAKVVKAGKPVLVDFFAEWCGPCKAAAPILDELADAGGEKYDIIKVNVDENQELAGKFGIMSIPTVVLFKDGEEVDRKIGFAGKQGYVDLLEQVS